MDWIKLHRKMLDNPIVFKDPDHVAVWIYLLLQAAWKEHETVFGGKVITLSPGQVPTGRKKIAKETGVNESKVKRILSFFKSNQLIDQQTFPYGSLITILSWDKHQKSDQQNDQQMTNEWPTSDQQVTTTEERKERKKERNIFYPPTVEEVRAYCLERGNGIDPEVFWNFYESKNWMVGKNKMKKWKSAIITWEKNHPEQKAPPPPKKTQEEIDRELMILEEIRAQESEQRRMEREALHGKNS